MRVFYPEVGDVRTRFLDMPVENVVTAGNLFGALRSSLLKRGLDLKNDVNEGCGQERVWLMWVCPKLMGMVKCPDFNFQKLGNYVHVTPIPGNAMRRQMHRYSTRHGVFYTMPWLHFQRE